MRNISFLRGMNWAEATPEHHGGDADVGFDEITPSELRSLHRGTGLLLSVGAEERTLVGEAWGQRPASEFPGQRLPNVSISPAAARPNSVRSS